jgi:hypothetical protein
MGGTTSAVIDTIVSGVETGLDYTINGVTTAANKFGSVVQNSVSTVGSDLVNAGNSAYSFVYNNRDIIKCYACKLGLIAAINSAMSNFGVLGLVYSDLKNSANVINAIIKYTNLPDSSVKNAVNTATDINSLAETLCQLMNLCSGNDSIPLTGNRNTDIILNPPAGTSPTLIIKYVTWDGSNWACVYVGGVFIHAPNGDFSKAHTDVIMNYMLNGAKWQCCIVNGVFVHSYNGDSSQSHSDIMLSCNDWTGVARTYYLGPYSFVIKQSANVYVDKPLQYKTFDGSNWEAMLVGAGFIHAPNGDYSSAHADTIMNYISGGNNWVARIIQPATFSHTDSAGNSHNDTIMNYLGSDGNYYTAAIAMRFQVTN